MPDTAPGLSEIDSLRKGGFTDQEISDWQSQTAQKLSDGGFSSQEIGEYFGQKTPDMGPVRDYFQKNLATYGPPEASQTQGPASTAVPQDLPSPDEEKAKAAKTWQDALSAGWQMSIPGILQNHAHPDKVLPTDAPWYFNVLHGAGMYVGDAIPMAVGGVVGGGIGGMAGVGAGLAAGNPLAAPYIGGAGAMLGGGAGSFALPTALRRILIDHYQKGDIQDFGDFWQRASSTFIETLKAGTVGAFTGAAGTATKALAPIANPVLKGLTVGGAEVATMVNAGKMLEGEVPSFKDYLETGVLIAGLHGGHLATGKLMSIWAETGVRPEQVASEAAVDPSLKQLLVSDTSAEEAAKIYKQRLQQFTEAGRPQSEADALAQLHADFSYATGKAAGMSPEAVANVLPLEIKKVEGAPPAPRLDVLSELNAFEESGKGFFSRNSDGTFSVFIRGEHGNDPNQWQNAYDLQAKLGSFGGDIKPDPQSGHLVMKVRDSASGASETSLDQGFMLPELNVSDDFFSAPAGKGDRELPPVQTGAARTALGDKPIILKESTVAKNQRSHPEIPVEENATILRDALYAHTDVFQDLPKTKPDYWLFVKRADKNRFAVIEATKGEQGNEIVSWYYLNDANLQQKIDRAKREGGQFLMIDGKPTEAAGLSALPPGPSGTITQGGKGGQTLDQSPVPTFYSKLQRTIEEKMPNSAPVEQVNGILKDIKPEERKWSGIDEFLKGKEKVSKPELIDFLRANQLEIKEVTKGLKMDPARQAEIDDLQNQRDGIEHQFKEATKDYPTVGDIAKQPPEVSERVRLLQDAAERIDNRIADLKMAGEVDSSKFRQYTLPGGENYREVLFRLPPKPLTELPAGYSMSEGQGHPNNRWRIFGPDQAIHGLGPTKEAALADLQRVSPPLRKESFKSSHWDELNVFAHVRLTDRTGEATRPVKPDLNEPSSDGLSAHSKTLTNLVESDAFRSKGLGGLKAKDQKAVLSSVIGAVRDGKVLGAVIKLVPVDVVNELTRAKLTPKQFFSDESMLSDSLSADPNAAVKLSPAARTALVKAVTGLVAEKAAGAPEAVRLSVDGSAAPGTIDVGSGHKSSRILFIEEIQSDQHQTGRKKGYLGDVSQEEISKVAAEIRKLKEEGNKLNPSSNAWEENVRQVNVLRDKLSQLQDNTGKVPDAPFRKTWHEFVLKRVIRMAAEGGYDRIGWATGEQSASHYDLQQHVKTIDYIKNDDGTYSLAATSPSGDDVNFPKATWTPEELDDVVGKEVADRIRSGTGKRTKVDGQDFYQLSGLDLKVGGEGMKGFYDDILPAFLNKFGKKFGAKVAETEIETPFGSSAIPPSRYEGPTLTPDELRNVAKNEDVRIGEQLRTVADKLEATGRPFDELMKERASPAAAEAIGGKMVADESKANTTVHSIEITPALKDAALNEGFPLFQKPAGAEPYGRIKLGDTKAVMELFRGANASTALHESWHYFFDVLGRLAEAPEATPAIKDMYAKVLEEVGADSRGQLTREQHEQLAKSGELYVANGEAPSPALKSVFDRFRTWLTDIYQSAKDALGVEISPQMKSVMDRMLSVENAERAKDPLNRQSVVLGEGPTTEYLQLPIGPQPPAPPPGAPPTKSAILDRIGEPAKRNRGLTWDQFYARAMDDLHPIKVFVDLAAGDKPLKPTENPYTLARLTRGTFGKADQFLEFSPFKFKTLENVGKSFKAVMEPVREDLDGFREYAIAARALELAGREIETGVPLDEAQRVVDAGRAKYGKVFTDLQEYQGHVLTYLKDSGILSEDAFNAMKEMNKDYVPFFRIMDEETGGIGKGLSVKNPVKAIRGSERLLVDPLESIIKNTYAFITLAERNRVLTTMLELAESSPRGEELMAKVKAPMKPTEVSKEEVQRFMDGQGIEGDAEAFTIFRPKMQNLANDEIAIYRDGKREVYRVGEEMATAIKGLDRQSSNLLVKMLAIPAKTLRAGTTLSPDFTVRNIIRDQQTAFTLSEHGYIPVYDALRGLGAIFKKGKDYQDWLKSGGANSAMVAIDRAYIQENVFKLSKETGLMSNALNVVKSPFELLRVTSELLENATRMGEFLRASQGDRSIDDIFHGGYSSREVTIDFARMGAKTRAMNQITAFWNAQLQGVDRMARQFKDQPLGTLAKVTAISTLPSVLLWWAQHDDERYKQLPRWQKDLFWPILTDKWVPATDSSEFDSYPDYLRRVNKGQQEVNKGTIWRIPKPFEVGVIFGSIPERVLEAYVSKTPNAMKDLSDALWQAFTPGVIPTVALPMVEHFANKSSFTGKHIVPAAMEGILPQYQYSEYTSETAKLLGKFVASMPPDDMRFNNFASPAVIENYIHAWSGNMGKYALQLADQALYKTGLVPDPVKPASTMADMPIIKAFVIRYPNASTQEVQDFFDRYKKSDVVSKTIKSLAHGGDLEDAQKELTSDANQQYFAQLSGIKEGISNQMKFIRLVDKNPEITPDEKRRLIDGIYYGMTESAKVGNELFRQIDEAMKPQKK